MFFGKSYSHRGVLSRASITIQIIEDVAIYKAQIFSSNGNIFGTTDKTSDIHLVVWKGLTDITAKFSDIVWKRFTVSSEQYEEDLEWGNKHLNQKSFTLTKEEINKQAKIQVEVYGLVDGKRQLVATDYISFIDVNDLQGSPTPPSNPQDGDLWLDNSVIPPRLMMWDNSLKMWVEVTVAGKDRRNLLRNSNFYKKTLDYWTKAGRPTIEFESLSGKKWARIRSNIASSDYCGLSQICNALPKSNYSFQILSQVYLQSTAPNGNMTVAFYSINENNIKTLIKEETFDITNDKKVWTITFTSLQDTNKIETIISGEENSTFDFLVTNTKLENYIIPTEWEIAIEDIQDALDHKVGNTHEEVFGSLTDNGKMQGMYVDIDEHGNKNFYFNASYIKTGKLLGEYIEGRNLLVNNKYGDKTFHIDADGNVSISAKKLKILINNEDEYEDVAGVSDIAWKIDIISSNGIVFKNSIVDTQLKAIVFKGKNNVTDQLNASQFVWKRKSENTEEDELWNNTKGKGVKFINITTNDVYQKATFTCEINDI